MYFVPNETPASRKLWERIGFGVRDLGSNLSYVTYRFPYRAKSPFSVLNSNIHKVRKKDCV